MGACNYDSVGLDRTVWRYRLSFIANTRISSACLLLRPLQASINITVSRSKAHLTDYKQDAVAERYSSACPIIQGSASAGQAMAWSWHSMSISGSVLQLCTPSSTTTCSTQKPASSLWCLPCSKLDASMRSWVHSTWSPAVTHDTGHSSPHTCGLLLNGESTSEKLIQHFSRRTNCIITLMTTVD